jgi:hypothetical protein
VVAGVVVAVVIQQRKKKLSDKAGQGSRGGNLSGGRKSTVKGGQRECSDCGVSKNLDQYKPTNTVCNFPCLRAKDNIYKACKVAGQLAWYHEQKGNPAKWKKCKKWYLSQCGAADDKKMDGNAKLKPFGVMQFKVHVSAQQQLIRDGVYQMMHIVAFQEFAKKTKNYPPRGLTPDEATVEFKKLLDEPDAVSDENGPHRSPTEDYRQRLGVLKETNVIDRNVLCKSQGSHLYEWQINRH